MLLGGAGEVGYQAAALTVQRLEDADVALRIFPLGRGVVADSSSQNVRVLRPTSARDPPTAF